MKKLISLLMATAIVMVVFAAPAPSTEAQDYDGTIRIGSKQFTEQLILGNMFAIALEEFGYNVEYTPLGSTSAAHEALVADEIDIYPEYTGTGYLTILGQEYSSDQTAVDVYNEVSNAYMAEFGVSWLNPSAFNNTYALAMTSERAEELGVTSISDLVDMSGDLTLGATSEFIDRPDGVPGIQDLYGFEFGEALSFDPGLKYSGLVEGEIDIVSAFGTDGQISAFDLTVLEDDLGLWPPYNVAPVVSSDIILQDPYVGVILNAITDSLDTATMSGLNFEVDGDGREPTDVAFDYFYENVVDTIPAPEDLPDPSTVTVNVGSKQFTEQLILGNMFTLLLEEYGYDASYTPLGSTSAAHEALVAGEIDVYPEYTGTGYLTILGEEYNSDQTAGDVYGAVSAAYSEQFGLTWLAPSSFNNTYALAMTSDRAAELGVTSISDLTGTAGDLTLGATSEFIDRPDGVPGIQDLYGFEFGEALSFDPGLKYSGLVEGEVDIVSAFGTDGQISAFDLTVLEDDLGLWPPYNVAPVMDSSILDQDPRVGVILNELIRRLDTQTMSELNFAVDGEEQEPEDVAFEFLVDAGLLGN
jgi:osmoprotectant transport system substrate-binding protein